MTSNITPRVSKQMRVGEAMQQTADKSSAVAEMGDRFATIDMGRKLGDCCAPFHGAGELGPHLTQCRLGRGLPP